MNAPTLRSSQTSLEEEEKKRLQSSNAAGGDKVGFIMVGVFLLIITALTVAGFIVYRKNKKE